MRTAARENPDETSTERNRETRSARSESRRGSTRYQARAEQTGEVGRDRDRRRASSRYYPAERDADLEVDRARPPDRAWRWGEFGDERASREADVRGERSRDRAEREGDTRGERFRDRAERNDTPRVERDRDIRFERRPREGFGFAPPPFGGFGPFFDR